MKLRTHFIIAKIAAEHTGFTFLEKTAFCIGTPSLLCKIRQICTKKAGTNFRKEFFIYAACIRKNGTLCQ